MRQDYHNYDEPLKIANAGTWFNYMFLMDMYRNTVEYVPINQENTTHPHEVENLNDLRMNPVSYSDWTKRLKDGKFTHLVIDLATFQNWSANPKCELMWALAHPEHFQLIVSDENIYFFRIINL